MDARVTRTDQELGGAPEGLDALTIAERIKATGGLGLFVAREIALAHGGGISAASGDTGTTFTVSLPRAPLT